MPLHVEYRGGVARSEVCRCRGNHVGGVESKHESLRDLAVYERSDLRDNLLDELLLRPAVGLRLAPYHECDIAPEQSERVCERPRTSVPLHVDELVRKVLVGAFLVGVSAYRVAIRRRGMHTHLAVKQSGECHVRIEVCDWVHSIVGVAVTLSAIGRSPARISLTVVLAIRSKKFCPLPSGEPLALM